MDEEKKIRKEEMRKEMQENQKISAMRNMLMYKSTATEQFLGYFIGMLIVQFFASVETNGFLMFVLIYLVIYTVILLVYAGIKNIINFYFNKEFYLYYKNKNFEVAYDVLNEKMKDMNDKKHYSYLRDLAVLEFFYKNNAEKANEYLQTLKISSRKNYRTLFRLRQYMSQAKRREVKENKKQELEK